MVFGFLRNSDNTTSVSRNNKKSLKHRKAAAVKSRNRKLLFEGLEERRVLTIGATQAEAAYSAQAILNANPGAPSGVYWIDPNGGSTSDAFLAYADMTTSGGGWTQVLRVDGNQTTFTYDSVLWTNSATLNPNAPGTFHTEYKNQAFSNLPLTQVLLSMETGGSTSSVVIPKSATSLQQVFNSGYQATSLGKSTWLGLVPGSAIDPNGYAEGFNNQALAGIPQARVRLGALGNNEPHVVNPDGWIGVGGYVATVGQSPLNSAGNQNSPIMGLPRDTRSYGYIYVRGAVPSDSTPPTVTSTFASGTIPAGTTTLNVNFSEATLGGSSSANYELRSAGANGVIGDGDDVIIPVSVSYGSTGAVLTVAALAADGYRLTVKSGPSGVTDTSGNQLDGDVNGIAGGDFVKNFVVGGSVLSFGADYNEALGDGSAGQTHRPVAAPVAGITDAIAVAGHFSHGLALKADGTVWAWGNNGFGQLGDGSTTTRTSAIQVAGLSNIVAIAAGDYHSLALRGDGTVWAWGKNGIGEWGMEH
ncbi:MAG: fibrinogen-like YCDxxxxGGGW domain-containing protein [Pirellulales bacterium]